MTDVSHFYGDGCQPPHAFVDVAGVAPTLTEAAFDEIVAAVSSTPEARMSSYAQPEPEPLLARLKRLDREATEGPWEWTPDRMGDADLILQLGHPIDEIVDTCVACFSVSDHDKSHPPSQADADLIVALRNLVPEVIEAFELLAELAPTQGAWSTATWERVHVLLSKVSDG